MKTASVRDLRQAFPRVLAWLEAGEKVNVTMRRQVIATLIPRHQKKRGRHPMPDLTSRLRKVFGHRVIPDEALKAIMDQDRGAL